MKRLVQIFSFVFFSSVINGQQSPLYVIPDTLKNPVNDSIRYVVKRSLCQKYLSNNIDSSLFFAREASSLAKRNHEYLAEVRSIVMVAYALTVKYQYSESLKCLQEAQAIFDTTLDHGNWRYSPSVPMLKQNVRPLSLVTLQQQFGYLMYATQDYDQAKFYQFEGLNNPFATHYSTEVSCYYLGQIYLALNTLDSAEFFLNKSMNEHAAQGNNPTHVYPFTLTALGLVYFRKGELENAKQFFLEGINMSDSLNITRSRIPSYFGLSKYYFAKGVKDSSLFYAMKAQEARHVINSFIVQQDDIYENLAKCYGAIGSRDSVIRYQRLALNAKDSINKEKISGLAEFHSLGFREQLRLRDVDRQNVILQGRIRTSALLAGIAIVLIIGFLLYRNNRHKQNSLRLLQGQMKETDLQKEKAENAVKELSKAKLDLEAKHRQLEIESGLEKVQSRTNAMTKSDELLEVIQLVFDQLIQLRFGIDAAGFLVDFNDKVWNFWVGVPGTPYPARHIVADFDNPGFNHIREAMESGADFFSDYLPFEEKNVFMHHYFDQAKNIPEERKRYIDNSPGLSRSIVIRKNTILFTHTYSGVTCSPEENSILKRFGTAFDQTYARFLDLQKAEDQAKEATIEAALERVRGRAMAMHSSTDLSSTVSLVFSELRAMGVASFRCGVGLFTNESRNCALYSSISGTDNDVLKLIGVLDFSGHPVFDEIYDHWAKEEDYFPILKGDQIDSYYDFALSKLNWPTITRGPAGETQYGSFVQFAEGFLYCWFDTALTVEGIKIQKRFASVISLTFKRYFELQKSEANAKEAIVQAALDRVRAEIASMRSTADLQKITPLIWSELTNLKVPFVRCGVFIMDDAEEVIHTYLSTPDGKAIAVFHLPYTTTGNIGQVPAYWRQKKTYIACWDRADFIQIADVLVGQGAISRREDYLNTLPAAGFYLHFLPFLQGMIYVANTDHLEEDQIQLIQSVADAFSTAYARYEDFTRLEAAKVQVENALEDLKQAQRQLIQSEKMASLGELTAGIAHEIQNPLNFVNNFAQINSELIEEAEEANKQGNSNQVAGLLVSLKDNEARINQHGQRADSIVKGMLYHSRKSSGQKEPSDINALADEYLRLSYHGLRARDKSFSAKINTSFDPQVSRINIVPQDIGRVLLNLYNNAFYAVSEKKSMLSDGYEPTVSVSTKQLNNQIEIRVRDNGNGISPLAMEKIFQPFFTTKPAGQGTGLGLSISFDIVKAHRGEITFKSTEGQGTEFTVSLRGDLNL